MMVLKLAPHTRPNDKTGSGAEAKVDGFISKTGETADVRKATYEESLGWYAGITADMFG